MVIKKEGRLYVVRSEKLGRNLGKFKTPGGAKNRLRQIEYFKKQKKFTTVKSHKRKGRKVKKHQRRL